MTPIEEVIVMIRNERDYQDAAYDPSEIVGSGLTRLQRDQEVTPHLILLDLYVQKAKDAWNKRGGNVQALRELVKIAAIAVRAIERNPQINALYLNGRA